jgi:uncharacterized surface protein with fasciclin (FAS1) repeats
MNRSLVAVAVAALLWLAAAPSFAQSKDIVDTAVAAGSFKTLAKLLTDADLVTVMKGAGPYTVFAPTDDAFAKVPKATLDALAKDKAKLQAVLKYHVLAGSLSSSDLKMLKDFGTVQGGRVKIGAQGATITIDDAKVVKPDVAASNGIIHVIDSVLMPK